MNQQAGKTSFDKFLDQMDIHQPRWTTQHATQRELQSVAESIGTSWGPDTSRELRITVGSRLFEIVRVWISLPECQICGKEVIFGKVVKS